MWPVISLFDKLLVSQSAQWPGYTALPQQANWPFPNNKISFAGNITLKKKNIWEIKQILIVLFLYCLIPVYPLFRSKVNESEKVQPGCVGNRGVGAGRDRDREKSSTSSTKSRSCCLPLTLLLLASPSSPPLLLIIVFFFCSAPCSPQCPSQCPSNE